MQLAPGHGMLFGNAARTLVCGLVPLRQLVQSAYGVYFTGGLRPAIDLIGPLRCALPQHLASGEGGMVALSYMRNC